MAGEYSRELSTKVFAGQRRLIEPGFLRKAIPSSIRSFSSAVSACPVKTMGTVRGQSARICRISWSPWIHGIRISVTTTSIECSAIVRRACSAVEANFMSHEWLCGSKFRRMAAIIWNSSSTKRIFFIMYKNLFNARVVWHRISQSPTWH